MEYVFEKLAKHRDPQGLITANLLQLNNGATAYCGDVCFGPESETIYLDWKKRQDSMQYTFKQELTKVVDRYGFDAALHVQDGAYPKLLTALMRGEVSYETVVWLDRLVHFLDYWEKAIADEQLWPQVLMKLRKYERILPLSVNSGLAMKEIAKEVGRGADTINA
jgi:hypothetical protein